MRFKKICLWCWGGVVMPSIGRSDISDQQLHYFVLPWFCNTPKLSAELHHTGLGCLVFVWRREKPNALSVVFFFFCFCFFFLRLCRPKNADMLLIYFMVIVLNGNSSGCVCARAVPRMNVKLAVPSASFNRCMLKIPRRPSQRVGKLSPAPWSNWKF